MFSNSHASRTLSVFETRAPQWHGLQGRGCLLINNSHESSNAFLNAVVVTRMTSNISHCEHNYVHCLHDLCLRWLKLYPSTSFAMLGYSDVIDISFGSLKT